MSRSLPKLLSSAIKIVVLDNDKDEQDYEDDDDTAQQ